MDYVELIDLISSLSLNYSDIILTGDLNLIVIESLGLSLVNSMSEKTRNIKIPRFRLSSSEKQFFITAVRYWNGLPHKLKTIQSVTLFKIKLHKHVKIT